MTKKILITIIILGVLTFIVASFSPKAYTPILTNTGTLDFPSTSPGLSADLTITVTGASVGDFVILGPPSGVIPSTGLFFGWVSASNTVTIRFVNTNILSAIDPGSGSFKVGVLKK